MASIVFLAYNYLPGFKSPEQWIKRIEAQVIVMEELAKNCSVYFIGHINYKGSITRNNITYYFLPTSGSKNLFPFQTHLLINKLKPDLVFIFGMHFPIQIIQLRFFIGKRTRIIEQYEADRPFHGLKKYIQQWADKRIDYYFFTAKKDAVPWIESGNIQSMDKCKEIYVGAPVFSRQNKNESKRKIGMAGDLNFLWVARLNENKDPLTVLKAFAGFLEVNCKARLHMIYQSDDMLAKVQDFIDNNSITNAVILHGCKNQQELKYWFSASDFFISASFREGGSYALMEAMACGCTPIVSDIPSSLKLVNYGEYGFFFKSGNVSDLQAKLVSSANIDKINYSDKVEKYFNQEFSASAIAKKISEYF